MTKLRTVLKILMFLGSLTYAALYLFIGAISAGPTSFFSAPNTPSERFSGYIALLIALIIFILSFSLFRKRFLKPAAVLFSIITFSVFYSGGQMDFMNLYYPYVLVALLLFFTNKRIGKDHNTNSQLTEDSGNRKTNKILIIIPIAIIILIGIYFTIIEPSVNQIQQKKYANVVADEYSYQQHVPGYVPPGYKKDKTLIGGSRSNYSFTEYRGSGGWFTLAQFKKPSNLDLSPPNCSVYGSSTDNFEVFYGSSMSSGISGNCQLVTSGKGLKIYIMQNPLSTIQRDYALVIIGNTLISIDGYNFSQEELVKMVDSLKANN